MEKEKNENNKEKLTVEESNMFKVKSGMSDHNFLSSKVEKILGDKIDISIEEKNGKIIYSEKIRSGGFYYLGSLITVAFLTFVVGICIYDILGFIKQRDIVNLIFFIIISVACSVIDYYYFKELIKEIREKREDKKMIKLGLKSKAKRGFVANLYRVLIILFVLFMIYGLLALLIQEIDFEITIPPRMNEVVFCGMFILIVSILLIVSISILFVTIIEKLKHK